MTRKIVLAALFAGLALAFLAFAWPTEFRYDHVTVDGDTYPVRIDRLTGDSDILIPGDGWTPAEDALKDQGDENQNRSGS